jgi:succinoglycan biosynthesis transport protein ExoP
MDLKQFILALGARRKAFLIAFAATIITAITVALIVPKKYIATSTLMVDVRDEQTMSPARLSTRDRASFLQTQVDLLMSNRVATQVARDLKLAQRPGVREAWEKDTGGSGQIDEWIAAGLVQTLDIDTSVSNMVLINFPAENPKFAAEVSNAFAKAYLDTVLALRTEPSREAAEWFDGQLKTLRSQVTQAQTKLNQFQKAKGILAEDRVDVESARLAELSTQLLAARNATYEAQTRHKQAAEIMADGSGIDSLKGDLGRVEARIEQESASLGPNHPQLQRSQAEAAALREKLTIEAKKVVAGLGNSVQQNRKRVAELEAALEAQNQRLLSLKDYRIDMAAMTRDIEAAQRSYDTVLTRYMANKIDSAAKTTNVALLAPASCTCSKASTAACARATTSKPVSPCRRSAGSPSGSPRAAGCCRPRCALRVLFPSPGNGKR